MSNSADKQKKVDKIKRLIDEARRAHDTDTVKALGEALFELTGVQEPEFVEVSSGNPELDHLRKKLKESISSRDDECEATLREMIEKIEGEQLPQVNIETAEEEPVVEVELEDEVENPFGPQDAELTPFVAEDYEDKELEDAIRNKDIGELFNDILMATQIAALREAGILNEMRLIGFVDGAEDPMESLVLIKGIGKSSAKIILETLGYGD